MQIDQIIAFLNQEYPLSEQESWDNCGVIGTNLKRHVQNPLVCLDINLAVLTAAVKQQSNLIISHHPWYLDLQELNSPYHQKISNIINKHQIVLFALHTCFDKHPYGMNYQLLKKIKCQNIKPHPKSSYVFIGDLMQPYNLKNLIIYLQKKWGLKQCAFCSVNKSLKNKKKWKIAIVGGSGAGEILLMHKKDQIDLFITSEVKWHLWNHNAFEQNFILLQVPHSIEKIFIPTIQKKLAKLVSTLPFWPLELKYSDHQTSNS